MAIRITAIIIALMGLALAGGGAYLLSLGGSAYYLLCGLGFLLAAALLIARKLLALHV